MEYIIFIWALGILNVFANRASNYSYDILKILNFPGYILKNSDKSPRINTRFFYKKLRIGFRSKSFFKMLYMLTHIHTLVAAKLVVKMIIILSSQNVNRDHCSCTSVKKCLREKNQNVNVMYAPAACSGPSGQPQYYSWHILNFGAFWALGILIKYILIKKNSVW